MPIADISSSKQRVISSSPQAQVSRCCQKSVGTKLPEHLQHSMLEHSSTILSDVSSTLYCMDGTSTRSPLEPDVGDEEMTLCFDDEMSAIGMQQTYHN